MSEPVRRQLFAGAFPVYSYMCLLRQFMRMNGVSQEQIEEFVLALSGKGLSVREVEQLAHGCFRGPESFGRKSSRATWPWPWNGCDRCPKFRRV